ncbi:AfsR/SARP family transcriptional regulator [Saccharomonospora amisosensis]|uniref:AfsR/SARP family transcriptional regulator n=1 Tax=Saccharomonospora amisosensis TaxID=1128677 RepID=UPI001FBA64F6|nr:BTAD domain-containing putative transcriptional regulator [Saccharomonospora amisosensis]
MELTDKGGQPVRLGGPRQQIVLAVLGLNVNRVTSIDQLIEAVWSLDPPATSRSQIQICVSRLRKLLDSSGHVGTIRTHAAGYCLEFGVAEVDSLTFLAQLETARATIARGERESGASALRAALSLWRGPALCGMESDVVRRGATGLDEQRMSAIEERIQLDLELGRHAELVAELHTLIGQHPSRERLYGFLMLALYRSGRQVEALEAYRDARAVLIRDVGVEPCAELQSLETAILNRDPVLLGEQSAGSWSAQPRTQLNHTSGHGGRRSWPVPQQLPSGVADFTGRHRETARIVGFLTSSAGTEARNAVPVVALYGRGGVGKSSLAVRVAHELSDQFPDGVLYADLQGMRSPRCDPSPLSHFLFALGGYGRELPDDPQVRRDLYCSFLAQRRVLIVLDDAVSEEQLKPLIPGSSTCAVIVTSRSMLSGLHGARHVPLGPLDPSESVEMLAGIIGTRRVHEDSDAAAELASACDGLPLAIRIAGGRLASRENWPIARLVSRLRDERGRLDELEHRGAEVRSNIALTYGSLDEQTKRLFRLLALVDTPDLPTWIAAALLDVRPTVAERLLENLVDAQVLDVIEYRDARGTRYRLHELVRVYAGEVLHDTEEPAERLAALERATGGWLKLAETAHRELYGGDYTTIHGSGTRWPAHDDLEVTSITDPMHWLDTERPALVAAVRQAAREGLAELAWDLALTCVVLFETKGYFDDWREVVAAALQAAERAGNRTGVAASLYSMGTMHMFKGQLGDAQQCFRDARTIFEAQRHDHGIALVLRNAAYVDRLVGDDTAMMAKYDEALRLLNQVGDEVGVAHVMRSQAGHWIEVGEHDHARELLDQALDIARRRRCVRVEAQVLFSFAALHLQLGELEAARQELHRVLRIVRASGDGIGEAHALCELGRVRYREGRLEGAERTLLHACELASQLGERLVEAKSLYTLGEVELARGNSAAATTHLGRAEQMFGQLGSPTWIARTATLLSEVRPDNRTVEYT